MTGWVGLGPASLDAARHGVIPGRVSGPRVPRGGQPVQQRQLPGGGECIVVDRSQARDGRRQVAANPEASAPVLHSVSMSTVASASSVPAMAWATVSCPKSAAARANDGGLRTGRRPVESG